MDINERIAERMELAGTYAEDGAYYSAARILGELADEVKTFADERNRLLGLAVNHIDGDPRNNDLSNLRLVDIRENRRGTFNDGAGI
jgi:hypothetical protein